MTLRIAVVALVMLGLGFASPVGTQSSAATDVVTCSTIPPDTVQCAFPPSVVRIEVLDVNRRDPPRAIASFEGSISFTDRPGTHLRIFRKLSSPLTFDASGLRSAPRWTLPPPIPGGELFLMFEPATVAPELIQITGTSALTIKPDKDPTFSFAGLADGRYTITRTYAGGRTGMAIKAIVANGKTADVVVSAETVGAADIVADGLRCQFMDGIRVWREDSRKRVTEEKTYPTDQKTCRWRIDGLPPGWYLVSAVARGGRGTIMTFEIVEQKVTDVVVSEFPVRLTGVVTARGVPVADASIVLTTSGERGVDVRTDASGEFLAVLPTTGKYTLMLRTEDRTEFLAVTLNLGDNNLDWVLATKGTIRVTADGFNLGSNITIRVDSKPSSKPVHIRSLEPGTELTIGSLDFGTYIVTAVQGALRSAPIEVKLDRLNDIRDVKVKAQ